jgi:hypothetical protein
MTKKFQSIKSLMSVFKQILKEASELYQKPMSTITAPEFIFTSNGRLGINKIYQLGGYIKLRTYVAPDKKNQLDKATKQMIEKIMGL